MLTLKLLLSSAPHVVRSLHLAHSNYLGLLQRLKGVFLCRQPASSLLTERPDPASNWRKIDFAVPRSALRKPLIFAFLVTLLFRYFLSASYDRRLESCPL